ncbi:hypothetical protein Hanom_Chr03g00247311 [Helianthus anomalus]
MASKTSESSTSAQASSDALYAKWGHVSFNNLVQEYGIRAEWNPILPSKTDTTFPSKKVKITLFSDFFKFCNFRLPISKFCNSVLDHYPLHISQLHLLGLVKLRQFERDIDVSCLRDIPSSSRDKDWEKKFFYIDVGVIHGEMQWMEMGPKDKVKDDGPPKDAYVENTLFKRLCQCPSECIVIPEGALVMAGMNLLWRDIRLYPSFQRDDEGKGSSFDFVDPPRNTTLRAADCVIGEQEPNVLKVHLDQFLLPTVQADPSAYISQPPPNGWINAPGAETKKPIWVKVTGRKYMAAGLLHRMLQVAFSCPRGALLYHPLLQSW